LCGGLSRAIDAAPDTGAELAAALHAALDAAALDAPPGAPPPDAPPRALPLRSALCLAASAMMAASHLPEAVLAAGPRPLAPRLRATLGGWVTMIGGAPVRSPALATMLARLQKHLTEFFGDHRTGARNGGDLAAASPPRRSRRGLRLAAAHRRSPPCFFSRAPQVRHWRPRCASAA
jgi:hypothetical protein